ncbi:MAG: HEAT repeat domain-containing protein [Hyphomicrobiales bacterium]
MRDGMTGTARRGTPAAPRRWGTLLAILLAASAGGAAPARAAAPAKEITVGPWTTTDPEILTIADREGARDTTGLAAIVTGSANWTLRAAAARALGRIQDRGSVPALVHGLGDRVAAVRREAAFALGLVGDSTAAPALAAHLGKEVDAPARVAIVTALGYLGARSGGRALARSLAAPRAAEREAAALAAARSRDSSLVLPLVRRARDTRADMRWRVAYALGRIGERRGPLAALRLMLRDRSADVRAAAARALGDLGDSASSPKLVALFHDPSWRVRVDAAHALAAVHGTRDARSLRPLLADSMAQVRWEATLAIGALRDVPSVPKLRSALRDPATGVVQAAAMALLKIQGEDAIPTIAPSLDLLPAFLRSGLIESLGELTGPASLEILLARLRESSDPAGAAGAASALAKRPGDRAASLPALRAALDAADFSVVCSAAEALGDLGDTTAVPAIAALLHRSGSGDDADVRSSAATALAALETPAALDSLAPARRDADRRVRAIATAALGLPPDSVAATPAPVLRVDPIPEHPARTATVETERGTFRIAFDAAAAPRTVENFARLARTGYFDGLAVHRVVPDFVIQDGCPRGDGWGGPGYVIPCEYNDLPYDTGTVGMALSGKDTGGSQWFVTLSPQPRLEGRYTVFGKVTSGMAVVERIMPGDRIVKITVE